MRLLRVLACGALLSGCRGFMETPIGEGSFERAVAVPSAVRVVVETDRGSIRVVAGHEAEVQVKAHVLVFGRRGDHARANAVLEQIRNAPPVRLDGGKLKVGEILDRRLRRSVAISYEIVVPPSASVESSTGSGSQMIEKIDGDVKASGGSGSITVVDAAGPLTASTGSGSIVASGSLGGHWALASGSGAIAVHLPPAARFAVEAQTGSGRVEIAHPLTSAFVHQDREVRGLVGGGGFTVEASTGSGSVLIN
jgi:hypothetical protein